MLGGFIWDWVDQSRAVALPYGGWDYYSESYAHKNLYSDESKGKYFGYGGDWGEKPNDNSFCENGIICPDRTPQPEADEVRYQYQSFWFSANASQLANNTVSVYNENSFLDLSDSLLFFELLETSFWTFSHCLKIVHRSCSNSTELIYSVAPDLTSLADCVSFSLSGSRSSLSHSC
jgi:beta-galactosidase/beta-glucuronidase